MVRDEERAGRIRRVLTENKWDAVACTLPSNVLLLSGYWPVIGSAIAIFTRDEIQCVRADTRRLTG